MKQLLMAFALTLITYSPAAMAEHDCSCSNKQEVCSCDSKEVKCGEGECKCKKSCEEGKECKNCDHDH
jgi:hypothetical protein